MSTIEALNRFVSGGMIPWSKGYSTYKQKLIEDTLNDPAMLARFRDGSALPDKFGVRIDERCVEYPWVFARLDRTAKLVLDAGSTFSNEFLLKHPVLDGRRVIIYTLETDWITLNSNVSYIFGDFRKMLLRDACVDAISCISTLEHVGLGSYDYKTYNARNLPPNQDLKGYKIALAEFARILKPGGQFLVTVPYGAFENHGWLQQFNAAELSELKAAFPGSSVSETYYRYRPNGWQAATAADCASERYYNIHASKCFEQDFAAAARAVACLEFRKS